MADLKVGDKVRILVDTPENTPVRGTVKVVQDTPGKTVGVELDEHALGGHSLDGELSAEKVDQNTGSRFGKGWWTIAENVEKVK